MDDSSFVSESFDSEACKMKKLKSGQTLDRLSELPDSLIFRILSSLEMKDVIGTTLLSKRWNNLWITIPCLCFLNGYVTDKEEETRNFINRALLLWKGTKIEKFKIYFWGDFDESLYQDMNLWLRFVTDRKVEKLCLRLPWDVSADEDDLPVVIDPLPHCLYECSSIRKLSLEIGCNLHICRDVQWDQLKSLTIKCFSVSEDVINRVVSGAPQLEIFKLSIHCESNEDLSIRSSSLKKLSIHKVPYSKMEYDPSKYTMLTIRDPNLEELVLSGRPYCNCLMMDALSLTDVTLDLDDVWDVVLGETLRQILPTFQHVEKLTLSSLCFKVLLVMNGKFLFSPLSNVKLLRFTCPHIKPKEIVGLFEIFPKLKTLAINRKVVARYPRFLENQLSPEDIGEPLTSEEPILKNSLMQLRTVKIGWQVLYDFSLFEFIEFFLKHATVLEKMVIQKIGGREVRSEGMFLELAQKLVSMQRSFPTVNLILCETQSDSVFE